MHVSCHESNEIQHTACRIFIGHFSVAPSAVLIRRCLCTDQNVPFQSLKVHVGEHHKSNVHVRVVAKYRKSRNFILCGKLLC